MLGTGVNGNPRRSVTGVIVALKLGLGDFDQVVQ
jgi:hypothetical protein